MLLFFTSLFLPAFKPDADDTTFLSEIGFYALLMGWFAILDSGVICWLANPLLLLAWIRALNHRTRPKGGLIASLLALIIALSVFLYEPQDEWSNATPSVPLTGLGLGAYVWISSMAAAVIGHVLLAKRQPNVRDDGGQ